jgi:hypothetical protein
VVRQVLDGSAATTKGTASVAGSALFVFVFDSSFDIRHSTFDYGQ